MTHLQQAKNCKPRLSRIAFLLCACISLITPLSSVNATVNNYRLSIEAQPLSHALIELAEKTKISIIFDHDITRNLESSALIGEFSLDKALTTLLHNTKLDFTFISDHAVAIKTRDCNDNCNLNSNNINLKTDSNRHRTHDDKNFVSEIVVIGRYQTGSRIGKPDLNQSTPIDIIDERQIELSGAQSISNIFNGIH